MEGVLEKIKYSIAFLVLLSYTTAMRSYGQQCAVAKALDVIGDRWSLLIVRELMIREACRYTDLREGLPGIATNLLADRLDDLEEAGIIVREAAPPPIATTVFRLTDRGRALEPVIAELGRWGAPLLGRPSPKDVFRDYWVALPMRLYVRDKRPADPPLRIGIHAGSEALTLETVGDGSVRVTAGFPAHPDATLDGPPHAVLKVLTGKLSFAHAKRHALSYSGEAKLRRFGAK